MVSFFGLKFGDKKKKFESSKSKAQQWNAEDQVQFGEGQYAGGNLQNEGMTKRSMRPDLRPGTAHSMRGKAFYDTSPPRFLGNGMMGSPMGNSLKHSYSDANLRTRFDESSVNLSLPDSGLGSRPATRAGSGQDSPSKQWFNGLDAPFSPSGLGPKSPLGQSEAGTKGEPEGPFGEQVDSVVDATMASIAKKENEEKEAKELENELEKKQETARLEQERLERQRATEAKLMVKPLPQLPPNATSLPPPCPPPQMSLPTPPTGKHSPRGKTDSRRDPRSTPTPNNHKNKGSGSSSGSGSSLSLIPPEYIRKPHSPNSLAPMTNDMRSKTPSPNRMNRLQNGSSRNSPSPNGMGPRLNADEIKKYGPRNPGMKGPMSPRVLGPMSPGLNNGPLNPNTNGRAPGPSPSPGGRMPSGSRPPSRPGRDAKSPSPIPMSPPHEPQEPFSPRPIIQDVKAKRDTLALSTPRRHSLAMKIEEFEQSIANAEMTAGTRSRSPSVSSSEYDLMDDEEARPVSPPSPLRITPSPSQSHEAQVDEQPLPRPLPFDPEADAPPIPSRALRRPTVGERDAPYRTSPPRVTTTPAAPDNTEVSSTPRRLTPPHVATPQFPFRQPDWDGGLSPADTDAGSSNYSRTPGLPFSAPLTPDSANWPLNSPISPFTQPGTGPTSSPASISSKSRAKFAQWRPPAHQYPGLALAPPAIVRARVPPPLNFGAPPSQGFAARGWPTSAAAMQPPAGGPAIASAGPGPDMGRGGLMSPLSPALASSKAVTPVPMDLVSAIAAASAASTPASVPAPAPVPVSTLPEPSGPAPEKALPLPPPPPPPTMVSAVPPRPPPAPPLMDSVVDSTGRDGGKVMGRAVSVRERRDRLLGGRMPDHGLKSPTGFADEHGTAFI